jgi:hypothetical protein
MEQDLSQKANEYKTKLHSLQEQKQEVERQLIILEEQYNQYKETIEQSFQTTDLNKLKEIADGYLKNIEELEKQL